MKSARPELTEARVVVSGGRALKEKFAQVLDPLADKMLMVTSIVLLSLPQMQLPNMLPRWLTILLISRDVLMMVVALVIVLMVFCPSGLLGLAERLLGPKAKEPAAAELKPQEEAR